MAKLVLGPLLRYVDAASATVWVETDASCEVTIAGHTARTFQVGRQHFALVRLEDLGPRTEYDVRLDGENVWPEPGSGFPKPVIRTGEVRRIAFGSCRAAPNQPVGPDALDAFAQRLMATPDSEWPQALILLGDQVYADEPTEATKQWLRKSRNGTKEPDGEVVHFGEYARLYHETWGDPEIRWLLSVVPTSMIFDDHDVRDDWNTSAVWRKEMADKPWWRDRIRGAISSYWVYQHLGNLGPDELARNPLYAKVKAQDTDVLPLLEEFAEEADREVEGRKSTWWSFRREFGRARLLMVDTRSGRILDKGKRQMVSDEEFEWLERNTEGDFDHLLIGSSLPWLMPHALSHFQSLNEIGARKPGWQGKAAEGIRQAVDLEHWPAFRESFDRLSRMIEKAANNGAATVCMLSGDVHHSYVAEAEFPTPTKALVAQLVCSPIHNEAPKFLRPAFRLSWSRAASWVFRRLATLAGVPEDLVHWRKTSGPHFGNSLALLDFDGRHARYRLLSATGEETASVLLGREPQ
ncbi:alkaline phosphatase D family protein [Lentzea albidocapillata]|uniref:Phosphodiesterase/alkaline phosphatase D n=1 Tax=Lentzea albidocapillata TaxID=40571 RepID=A0A1W2EY74_9PSEU|nr:alkaline phosphatase D family protein [Lentzea albidocapillata]SMD14657.1 Phosphodiesterase/alkaline phosphatase D [Lentzea albidocapillata]